MGSSVLLVVADSANGSPRLGCSDSRSTGIALQRAKYVQHRSEERMRFCSARALVVIAGLALYTLSAISASAQSSAGPASVVVAIFDEYPAFKANPVNGAPRTRELRAIVIPRDHLDPKRSLVILNPAHVTSEVLYAALASLQVATTQPETNILLVTGRSTPAPGTLAESTRAVLSATIAELLAREPALLRGHRPGKYVTLTGEALAGMRRSVTGEDH